MMLPAPTATKAMISYILSGYFSSGEVTPFLVVEDQKGRFLREKHTKLSSSILMQLSSHVEESNALWRKL
jgi:hypothetical protein